MRPKPYHCMQHTLLSLVFLAFLNIPLNAQVAVGQWRDHLPYQNGLMVADAGDLIYYAGEDGLFSFHKTNGDVTRLSKITGMSDVGYSAIAYSKANNTLVVAYKNTNIDLIQNNTIINIPDIRDKQIAGNKTINNIHLEGDYAYLACGFGIVVLDITKNEIRETYYIGNQGAAVNVLDISSSPTELFACTDGGMKRASKSGVNLADFSNWSFFPELPLAKFNTATFFNDMLFVNLQGSTRDTTYYQSSNQWFQIDTAFPDRVIRLENSADRLLFMRQYSTVEYSPELERLRLVNDYYNGRSAYPSHAIAESNGFLWIADKVHGLIKYGEDLSVQAIGINGPTFTTSYNISAWDGRLYVASGAYTPTLATNLEKPVTIPTKMING